MGYIHILHIIHTIDIFADVLSGEENERGGSYTTAVYEEAAGREHKWKMPSIYGLLVCYCEHIWNNTPLHLALARFYRFTVIWQFQALKHCIGLDIANMMNPVVGNSCLLVILQAISYMTRYYM
jgi:hypothetical protein